MTRPQLVLLAGPNGAGKSTFYEHFLADSPLPYLDADALAANAGLDALEAARVLDGQRAAMIEERHGFISETVFSDPDGRKLDMLRSAIEAGFEVELVYIGLSSPRLASRRIDQRVARGGHDVPRDKLAPRHARSLANLATAIEFVPAITLYDNSSVDEPYRFLARFQNGTLVERGPGRTPAWARDVVPRVRR